MTVSRARAIGGYTTIPSGTVKCGHAKTQLVAVPPYQSKVYFDYDVMYPYAILYGNRDLCLDETHPGPPYLTGGPLTVFHTKDTDYEIRGEDVYCAKTPVPPYGTVIYEYSGGFYPSWPDKSYPFVTADLINVGSSGKFSGSYGDPSQQGPTAWNRFKPKLSNADLGIFTGEFREVPRMLKTTGSVFHAIWKDMGGSLSAKEMYPKRVADHYLNTQFGWLPFIRDLVSFFDTYRTADRRLSQLYRDNGQWVRRKGLVGSTTLETKLYSLNTDGSTAPWLYPTLDSGLTYKGPEGYRYVCEINSKYTMTQSFSGAFKYWLPSYVNPDKRINKVQNYLRLYGARINPSLVWNLTPWSWLADWVTNVGDNISNYTSMQDDNLVSKYAFIMQSTDEWLENHSRIYIRNSGGIDCRWLRGCSAKRRGSASPFGFAIDTEEFTPRQWSILTALGFSKLKLKTS